MESRRIVMASTFYPPYHLGGDAVHVRYLAEELVRRGHEVHVVHSLDAFALKVRGKEPKVVRSDVHTHPVNTSLGATSARMTYVLGTNRAAERELDRVVREVRPDWIHHHNISLLGQHVLSISDTPKMYTAHDHWLACPRSDLAYLGGSCCETDKCIACSLRTYRPPQLWRGSGFRKRVQRIDRIISPSRYMATFLKERVGVDSNVLPNFVPRPEDYRKEDMPPHFVFVGVLEKHKGLDLVLRAHERYGIRSELHVLGSGSLGPMLKEHEQRTGGKVRGLGFLSRAEVLAEVGTAIALVSPSTCQENSPLSAIEALSVGTPLIVSPNGGLPELVAGGCGIVAQTNVDGIGMAMRHMEEHPQERADLSARALNAYESAHSPDSYVNGYLKLAEGIA